MLTLAPALDDFDGPLGFSDAIPDFLELMSVKDVDKIDQGSYIAVGWIRTSALRLVLSAAVALARDVSTTCHNCIV